MDKTTHKIVGGVKKAIANPTKLINFLKTCTRKGVRSTIVNYLSDSKGEAYFPSCAPYRKYSILTTMHCLTIARQMKTCLDKLGFQGNYYFAYEDLPKETDVLSFVICPQFFSKLPADYVVVQLEQSSSPWFNEKYWQLLRRAQSVLEFSEKNLSKLQENGIPLRKIFYLPITPNFSQSLIEIDSNPHYDIGFVGALNDRRKKILDELKKVYSVNIITNKFDKELEEELKKCKVLLNIHYYENDSLETTRLTDFSKYSAPILSENSEAYEKVFFKRVVFFKENDIKDLFQQVKILLNKVSTTFPACEKFNYFDFYLLRFLLAKDLINFSEFFNSIGKFYPISSSFLCLTLTETPERKSRFMNHNTFKNIQVMEGLRHDIGWVGCGMSYKYFASLALLNNVSPLTICEDDVEEKPNTQIRYNNVLRFLEQNQDWSLFSGLMADVDDSYKVLKVNSFGEEKYINTNKTVSAVFNIYNRRCLLLMTNWSPYDRRKDNTIDRYIESSQLSGFYTILPFLVGQSLDVSSSIWTDIQNVNRLYDVMIKKSEANLLFKLQLHFKEKEEE